MDFQFMMFEPKKLRQAKSSEPTVEITPSGRIAFNKAALELLNSNRYCKIGFDSENRAIGILPLSDADLNSFPIHYTAKGAYVGAKKFFSYFNALPLQAINATPLQTGNFIGLKL